MTKPKALGLTSVAMVLLFAGSAPAARVHLLVSPTTVSPGGIVTVSAKSSPCLRRDQVILLSAAFPGHAYGIGGVYGNVGRHGSFSVPARIRKRLPAGRYHVGARCGGGNLGVLAYFRVR